VESRESLQRTLFSLPPISISYPRESDELTYKITALEERNFKGSIKYQLRDKLFFLEVGVVLGGGTSV
jgi:hypothetical protein